MIYNVIEFCQKEKVRVRHSSNGLRDPWVEFPLLTKWENQYQEKSKMFPKIVQLIVYKIKANPKWLTLNVFVLAERETLSRVNMVYK